MNMSLVLHAPRKMHLSRSSSNVPRLPSILEMVQNPHVLLTFDKVHNPLCLPRETTSERQKVVGACGAFNILTSKCANWGSLAELLRFWCCQLWKMKKSRRIPSFLTLSSSNIEEVSQNCCVFDVVKFKTWGRLAEELRFQAYRKTGR